MPPVQPLPPQPPQPTPPPAQGPAPGEPGHDPYAFFMDPQASKGRSPLSFLSGGGTGKKIAIAAGALLVLIMLFIIGASLLTSGDKAQKEQLLTLAQTQQEVIRVATDGAKNTQSSGLKNFANTTVISLSSDQRLLLAQLQKAGLKTNAKQLALGKNARTDQALSAAAAANTYDITFATTMASELDDYQSKLEGVLQSATSAEAVRLLKQEISNVIVLHKQLQGNLTT